MKALVGVYLRFLAVLFLLFSAALLLIRIQPRDDHELRQLLLPDGCPAPCFMGIRPNVTTRNELMKLLETSEWVRSYEFEADETLMNLEWNSSSPSWLRKGSKDRYNNSRIRIANGLVESIELNTHLTLGDIQLLLGPSPFQVISSDSIEGQQYLAYSAIYPDGELSITVFVDCDKDGNHIDFKDEVFLNYTQFKHMPGFPDNYKDAFNDSWADVLHTSCAQH